MDFSNVTTHPGSDQRLKLLARLRFDSTLDTFWSKAFTQSMPNNERIMQQSCYALLKVLATRTKLNNLLPSKMGQTTVTPQQRSSSWRMGRYNNPANYFCDVMLCGHNYITDIDEALLA